MSVPATNPNITGANYVSYASPYSKAVAFGYISDPNLVLYTQQGTAYQTGGFRPASAYDLHPQTPTVGGSTMSGSLSAITTGLAIPNNPARTQLYAQVVGTGAPLFILFGTGIASTTNFNVLLKADSPTNYAGAGGVLSNTTYTGPVTVSGGAGCIFTIWQA